MSMTQSENGENNRLQFMYCSTDYTLNTWCTGIVVSRKRAHGRYTLLCAQTRGWADICNITAFYHEKTAMFTSSQPSTGYCRILHTSGVAKLGHTGARALATRGGAPPVQVIMGGGQIFDTGPFFARLRYTTIALH